MDNQPVGIGKLTTGARRGGWAVPLVSLIALLAFCFPARASAQTGPIQVPPGKAGSQKPATRELPKPMPPPLVSLDVLVTDQDGVVLAGLKQSNFRVLDNGKLQTITHFEPVGAPITIVMLLEYSGTAYNYFAYKGASWASTFLNHLEAQDYVALVTYDIRPTVRVDFTHNKAEIRQALNSLSHPSFRVENMYDALIDTLDRLDRVKGKKAILLIGTGASTMGRGTLDKTLKRIKRSDVTIFSIGVAEAEYQSAAAQRSGGSSITYLQWKNALQTFAKLTGGMAWFPRFEGEIPSISRSVATHLRGQYRLGFSPPNLAHDGKYHKLKVEIVGVNGKPLVVTNPKGKRRKVEVYAREGYTAPPGNAGK